MVGVRMNKKVIIESIGWGGVILILGAFMLNTFGLMDVKNIWYSIMNVFGAIGVVVSSIPKRNWQPVVINGVWFLVAVIGIIKALALHP
ncbi:hypothetical protein B7Y92_01815 [Candidatus Saccharibacteria bacterium 32-50-13]|nr:MAG: hypothetical protein B7Y92_01815 [Candidatus Saccharibacteria bacterium 32-50-13]